MDDKRDTYLGFELSTLSLKAILLDAKFQFLAQTEVKFDTDLPEFKTSGGFNTATNNAYYYVRPIMMIKAVDMALDRLLAQNVKFSSVACISGSAQQHGFVLWTRYGIDILKNAIQEKNLSQQLHTGFVMDSLIWSDNMVEQQCEDMEKVIGGKVNMWKITGSKCYPQFTGPQIRKLYGIRQDVYEKSDKISVFSSFMASLFIGDIAPIEYSDASSMNLLDIHEKKWSKVCLQACAPNLEKKLGTTIAPCTIIGTASKYLREKYGFTTRCKITSFTGDAASTYTGFLTGKDWIILSLGERDTLMLNISSLPNTPELESQVICHPVSTHKYLAIVSFKNGDMARNYILRTEANNSWETFNALLDNTSPGNNGNMALYLPDRPTGAQRKNSLRWNSKHSKQDKDSKKGVKRFSSSEVEIRAVIEGQMLHRRLLAQNMGFEFNDETKILLTGVDPDNKPLIKVIADVFSAPVYMMDTENSTLYGDVYRSKYSLSLHYSKQQHPQDLEEGFEKFLSKHMENHKLHVCNPRENSSSIYAPMLERSRDMLNILQGRSLDTEF